MLYGPRGRVLCVLKFYQWQYLFMCERKKRREIGTRNETRMTVQMWCVLTCPVSPPLSPCAPSVLIPSPPDLCCFALQVYSPLLLIAAVEPLRRHFLSDSVPCKVRGVVHELVGGGMTDTDARTCVEFMCNSILKVRPSLSYLQTI